MCLVSVIIPFYKKHQFIEKSIDSVINQLFKNIEIIIIHDDPSDKNFSLIERIKKKDKRIKIIRNTKNLGAGISRNLGIAASKGEYIAFLDADDVWYPDKLTLQIDFMRSKNIEFSHTSYEIVNENGNILSERISPAQLEFNQLIKSCDIGLSSVILKKTIIKNFEFPPLKTKEDYVLWLMLSKSGIKIYSLNKILMKWRKLDNSLSSNILQKLIDGFRVYNIYLKYNFILSLKCLFILSVNFIIKKNKL